MAVVTAVAVALLLVWRSPARPRSSATTTDRRPSSTATAAPSPTTTVAPSTTPPQPYAVGTTTMRAVDRLYGAPRVVPIAVRYPATRAGAGAPAARSGAPYPLLVFSQGYAYPVSRYSALLTAWAEAGFVVAAPTYPHTDPGQDIDEGDILYHPADLRAAITAVLRASGRSGTALSGLVDAAQVGVVGQSDGGDVTLAVAANTCCRDVRVRAAAILSGAELGSYGGTYFPGGSSVPLLVVQGSDDRINPPACSQQLYDAAPPPKYYLDLIGAGHIPPYTRPVPDRATVETVTTDFFLAELAGEHAELAAMREAGTVAGRAALTSGSIAPPAPGDCPGAP
jgi:dienelactone hydrolase